MKKKTVRYGFSSLGSAGVVFFFFFCQDFNDEQKGKAQSCFYSEERFPPICCGWRGTLKRKLHPASPAVRKKERKEAMKREKKKKSVRLIDSHYHVCCVS